VIARILAGLIALAVPVIALPADTLYVGEAVLPEDRQATVNDLADALDEVLARLTGRFDESLIQQLGLGPDKVRSLVLARQRFERERPSPDGELATTVRLRAEFDPAAVREILTQHGLPRWGQERPAILLWVAVEDEAGTRFLSDPYLEYLIAENGRRLGLDIVLPLGDALDLAEVTLADVRGGFLGSAEAGALRYGAGVTAMLDLRSMPSDQDDSRWRGRWFWRIGEQDQSLNRTAADLELLVETGLERVASSLAARYAVHDAEVSAGLQRIRVSGIVDEVHYALVLDYLENLSVVEQVRVLAADQRAIDFQLLTTGGNLAVFLEMGGLLVPETGNGGDWPVYRLRR